jgi:hypothetical protein
MHDDIAQRIAKSAGEADLVDTLAAKISGSELHSILLAVLKQRVGKVEKAALMQPSPVTKACDLDGRLLNKIEGLTYAAAAGYDAIELSPLNPFGAVPVLTGLDLANILSTVRAFECASDPTVGMALECARRRKKNGGAQVCNTSLHQSTCGALPHASKSCLHLSF